MAIKLNKQLYTGKDELTGSAGFAFFYFIKGRVTMAILESILKVFLSLALGIMFFGVFLCFAGSDIDNVDWWWFWFCLAIGIGMFVVGLCALFSV